jgi:hypothetical protein
MKQRPIKLFCLAAVTVCGFFGGCSGGEVATVPVHGKVTMGGKPLTGGIVSFQPVQIAAGLPNHISQGAIQADGQYTLSSFRPDDGAVPGEYTVTIQSVQAHEPFDQFSKAPPAPSGPKIPAIYSSAESTTLKATVPTGGSAQQIDFDLKEK